MVKLPADRHIDDVAPQPGINKVAVRTVESLLHVEWHARNDIAITRNCDGAHSHLLIDSGAVHGGCTVHR
jgi:hypothetical protein